MYKYLFVALLVVVPGLSHAQWVPQTFNNGSSSQTDLVYHSLLSGHVINSWCQVPITLEVRCNTSYQIKWVSMPLTQLYTGAVGGAVVTLAVDGSTTTVTQPGGLDGSYTSSNRSFSQLWWATDFTCDESTTTLTFTENGGSFYAFSPNSNGFSNPNKSWLSVNCTGYATNTRPIMFSMYGSITPCEEGGDGLSCDMASTTQAVYDVGMSLNIQLGILLAILFGVWAFVFIRSFMR